MDWLTWGMVLKLSVLAFVASLCVGFVVHMWRAR